MTESRWSAAHFVPRGHCLEMHCWHSNEFDSVQFGWKRNSNEWDRLLCVCIGENWFYASKAVYCNWKIMMNALHSESLLHAFGIEWWKKYDKEQAKIKNKWEWWNATHRHTKHFEWELSPKYETFDVWSIEKRAHFWRTDLWNCKRQFTKKTSFSQSTWCCSAK